MSGPARASISAAADVHPGRPDLEAEAEAWVREALESEEGAGRLLALQVAPLRYEHVAGLLGVAVDARFLRDGTPITLTAHFFARGTLVYSIVLMRPEGLPEYERVFERVLERVRPVEPAFVREARARALLWPGSYDALVELAEAEASVGAPRAAEQALLRARELEPRRLEAWVRAAALALEEGRPREACRSAAHAFGIAPEDPSVLVALADCSLARGDHVAAEARLRAALRASPDREALRERLRRMQ